MACAHARLSRKIRKQHERVADIFDVGALTKFIVDELAARSLAPPLDCEIHLRVQRGTKLLFTLVTGTKADAEIETETDTETETKTGTVTEADLSHFLPAALLYPIAPHPSAAQSATFSHIHTHHPMPARRPLPPPNNSPSHEPRTAQAPRQRPPSTCSAFKLERTSHHPPKIMEGLRIKRNSSQSDQTGNSFLLILVLGTNPCIELAVSPVWTGTET